MPECLVGNDKVLSEGAGRFWAVPGGFGPPNDQLGDNLPNFEEKGRRKERECHTDTHIFCVECTWQSFNIDPSYPQKDQPDVLVGFAGSVADAFALLHRLEGKLDEVKCIIFEFRATSGFFSFQKNLMAL